MLTEALGLTCCPSWLQFVGFTLATLQAENWSQQCFSRLSSNYRYYYVVCVSGGRKENEHPDLQINVYIFYFFSQDYSALLFVFCTLKIGTLKYNFSSRSSSVNCLNSSIKRKKHTKQSQECHNEGEKLLKREMLSNVVHQCTDQPFCCLRLSI